MYRTNKAKRLEALLRSCDRVALAFSGGVDSSLLLRCALDTLGADNVLVLFACSELLSAYEIKRAKNWAWGNNSHQKIMFETVQLSPLEWEDFVSNGEDRCYVCKHRIYTLLSKRMKARNFSVLIDGTTLDDLTQQRPGLRAIRELGVRMPLVEAQLHKSDVRELSRRLGLNTWDQPSSSCLATRLPKGMTITHNLLRRIDNLEQGLAQLGLIGCRVRLCTEANCVHLEIRAKNFDLFAHPELRLRIQAFFKEDGINKVLLDIEGRM